MEWYRRLYLSESLEGDRDKLISKIEKNAGTRRLKEIYLLTLAANGKDLFDIFKADYLLQPVLHGHCPMIVAIADSYEDAEEIAISIIMDNYEQNHDFNILQYLKDQIRDDDGISFTYPMEKLKRRSFLFRKKDRNKKL